MNITEIPFVADIVRLCDDGWKQGWHEYHGGNLSYRLTKDDRDAIMDFCTFEAPWIGIGLDVPALAGEYLLVTAAGQIFRNTSRDPERSLGIIRISNDGKSYQTVWGYVGGRPTSELPAHLANHQVLIGRSGGKNRIVYHSHPDNLIALSFVLPLKDEIFTRELWEMMPECIMTFPEGIGVIPFMVPGTPDIAAETMKKMEIYNIILWAQHGVFAVGPDPDTCFGLVHTAEKAAGILIKVLSVVPAKRCPPTAQDLRNIARDFHLDPDERFLYEE